MVSAIETATDLTVYTIPVQDAAYPYVLIEDFTFDEIGNKTGMIYEFDVSYNIMIENPSSIAEVHNAIEDILGTVNKVDGISVSGYTMIKNDIIGTSTQNIELNGNNYYSSILRIKYWLT